MVAVSAAAPATAVREEEKEEEEEVVVVVVVFTREHRGGTAQHATRATPNRSSHGPMRS